jgi:KaiC/GvpD/RAD55 family RecA-like ATPase
MPRKAEEQFNYKPTGPYKIYRVRNDGSVLQLKEGILRKKQALSLAKTMLKNGDFSTILVQDAGNHDIYTQQKNPVEALQKDIRFRALLRLILVGPKMAQTFRHAVMVKFAEEYKGQFPTSVGTEWLPEEDEAMKILMELGAPDNTFIANLLGRTESAVSHRILRMGYNPKTILKRTQLFK